MEYIVKYHLLYCNSRSFGSSNFQFWIQLHSHIFTNEGGNKRALLLRIPRILN